MSTATSQPSSPTQSPSVTPERILQLGWGFAPPIAIASAVKTGLFDSLESGPQTVEALAAATETSTRGVGAVADVLVSFGLLTKSGGNTYALGREAAAFLVRGKPGYLGGQLERMVEDIIPTWLHLPEVMRSGEPSRAVETQAGGAEFFERLVENLFHMNYPAARVLAAALYPEQPADSPKVLDIAAGSGVWSLAVLQAVPQATATAVDWPNVLGVTRRTAQRLGLADRLETIGGNMQEVELGSGYDVAILGHVLHSEGAEQSLRLLRRMQAALRPGGRIAIPEFLVNEDRSGPPHGTIFNVNMLVHTRHGQTFSEGEIFRMLEESGFREMHTVAVPAPSPVIVATRA